LIPARAYTTSARRLSAWIMLAIGLGGIVVLLAIDEADEAVTEFLVGVIFGAFWWIVERRWVRRSAGPVTRRTLVRLALFFAVMVAIPLVGLGAPPFGIALGFGLAWLAP
jgi:hypothetical protein